MGLQACLDLGDGLGGLAKEDGVDAKRAGASDAALGIVEDDHLRWLHAQSLARQLKDALLRLGDPLLMGVDDEVAHLGKMVALLLFASGADKTVAQQRGLVARAQVGKVGGKLNVELA